MNRIKQIAILSVATPSIFFLFVSIFFGSILLLTVPPFQTPDENIHFYRAYEVSELKRPNMNIEGQSGSYLPLSIRQTEERTHAIYGEPGTTGQIMFNAHEKYDYRYTKSAYVDISLNENVRTFYATSGSPDYMPLSYLPQALTVAVARLFDAPIIAQLYMVRLTNLIIWISCGFIAIKLFPIKKWTVAAVALLPVGMSQAISPGLDPSIFGASFIFIAIVLKAMLEKNYQLNWKHLVALIVSSLVMVFGKSILALFLVLVFFIPNKRFKVIYPSVWKYILLLFPILLYLLWGTLLGGDGAVETATSSSMQAQGFMKNPFLFLQALINTFIFTTPSGSLLAQSLVGNFGWLDTPMSPFIVGIGYILIAGILFLDYEKKIGWSMLTILQIRIMAVIAVLYVIAVFLAMYIYFTLPHDNHIRGVNGRYFVPLMFLLIPLLSRGLIKMSKENYIRFIIISTVLLALFMVVTIVLRYYFTFTPT